MEATPIHVDERSLIATENLKGKTMSEDLHRCHHLFGELESQRIQTVSEVSEWPLHRLSFRPAPGSWCAIEVLDHIVRSESGTISDVRIGLKNPNILSAQVRPGIAALDQALRSEQSFKVPAAATDIYPDVQTTLPEVVRRWEQARGELRHLLEEITANNAKCGVFEHPFAGWMTFAEVLDHFSAHLFHHGFQLARLRKGSLQRV